MDNAEISVIMPVYNAGVYLKEALECVASQDFINYIMYCIDDCSDDGSYQILLEYAENDKRIRVFRNEKRSGAAYSRNFALKMVDTKYVGFLDADDRIEPSLFSELSRVISTYEADIAYCEWNVFEGQVENVILSSQYPVSVEEREVMRQPHCLKDLSLDNALSIDNAPWLFLFRKKFLDEWGLEFQSLSSRNDVYFIEMAKMLANKMVHVQCFQALIHQREHRRASRIHSNPCIMNVFSAFLAIKNKMGLCKVWEDYRAYFILRTLKSLRYAVISTFDQEQRNCFVDFLKEKGLQQLGITGEVLKECKVSDNTFYLYQLLQNGTIKDIMQENLTFKERLVRNSANMRSLLQSWKGMKVAFWGIGRRMDSLFELFERDIDFTVCFIDIRKAGCIYREREILNYDQAVNQNDIVVILNHLYRNEITDEMNRLHGKEYIVDVERILQ